jgi:hypothetical protein
MNDYVYVATNDGGFRTIDRLVAEKRNMRIAKCYLCDRYATMLDHCYPYQTEYNRCDEHKGNY